jgi:uncharacterized protein YdeI (YjbR/CyaY-like superfamily)
MAGQSPLVDAYIAKQAAFSRPILTHLRGLFHQACPEIEETIKWGLPYFECKGMVGGIAAFKKHVSLGFWKGKLMSDPKGLFKGVGSTQMSALKLHALEDLPDDGVLIAYIREAVELNEKGVKLPTKKPSEERFLELPEDLMEALRGNAAAQTTFDGFSFTNRKDYVEWITDAKREATREKRVAQAVEWMAEGKPRNWKYMPKYRSE